MARVDSLMVRIRTLSTEGIPQDNWLSHNDLDLSLFVDIRPILPHVPTILWFLRILPPKAQDHH